MGVDLCLVECSAGTFLKFSRIFEVAVHHLHFALSPTNDVASPGWALILESLLQSVWGWSRA